MSKTLTIALAGNPNSGKSTIFNNLTGAHQKVANWPGVTVEKKIGKVTFNEYEVNVVDLPGTYSLTAASMEEVIARNFVIKEKPDVVVDILDASNLERNLYLATRFKELGVKLVFALNMVDVAKSRGLIIDENKLGNLLGVPIVSTVGTKNIGTLALLQTVVRVAEGKDKITREIPIYYGEQIEEEIKKIEPLLYKLEGVDLEYPSRWLTLKLLENDQEVVRKIGGIPGGEEVLKQK